MDKKDIEFLRMLERYLRESTWGHSLTPATCQKCKQADKLNKLIRKYDDQRRGKSLAKA